jgi:hypothetical protein
MKQPPKMHAATAASIKHDLTVVQRDPATLRPDPHNARKHSQHQLTKLGAVICEFGFTNPVLIDEANQIIAGPCQAQSRNRPRHGAGAHDPAGASDACAEEGPGAR